MCKWIVTGISGSGWKELLADLKAQEEAAGRTVLIHDVAELIRAECERHKVPVVEERILDIDRSQLRIIRSSALKDVKIQTMEHDDIDLHLIGVHATFRWKGRLLPGISYQDVAALNPDGFINIVHDVQEVFEANQRNPKWDEDTIPGPEETQDWMIEEEFVTEILAEVSNAAMYLVARNHNLENLADLLYGKKKKVYLSYPITAVRESNPELLNRIQGEILDTLMKHFVVFDPLAVKDMPLTYDDVLKDIPTLESRITPRAKELLKKRTIERDFQFIDQSDAVVVFYLTDKVSPGVLGEIYYAHRNQKPVFMVLPGAQSPFIEDATTVIVKDVDSLMAHLEDFASA